MMRTGPSRSAEPDFDYVNLRGIPIFWYKKATQVFDTAGVDREISGNYPQAAGGSGTPKRTKSL
jgi:hypothetical protein